MWPVFVLIYHLSFIITSIQTSPQTIQVAVGSTAELPCTASRRNDSINPAKVKKIMLNMHTAGGMIVC